MPNTGTCSPCRPSPRGYHPVALAANAQALAPEERRVAVQHVAIDGAGVEVARKVGIAAIAEPVAPRSSNTRCTAPARCRWQTPARGRSRAVPRCLAGLHPPRSANWRVPAPAAPAPARSSGSAPGRASSRARPVCPAHCQPTGCRGQQAVLQHAAIDAVIDDLHARCARRQEPEKQLSGM